MKLHDDPHSSPYTLTLLPEVQPIIEPFIPDKEPNAIYIPKHKKLKGHQKKG